MWNTEHLVCFIYVENILPQGFTSPDVRSISITKGVILGVLHLHWVGRLPDLVIVFENKFS